MTTGIDEYAAAYGLIALALFFMSGFFILNQNWPYAILGVVACMFAYALGELKQEEHRQRFFS